MLATLPKSGTDFTVNNLMRMTDLAIPAVYTDAEFMETYRTGHYPLDDRLISFGSFDTQFLLPTGVARYAKGGFLVPTHMGASHHNLCTAREAGFQRITIMMREPRDATVSLTYHIRKAGAGLRNLHSEFQYLPPDYFDWSHEDQLAFQVRVFLPRAINWIEGWFDAVQTADPDFALQFVYFDELRSDSASMLSRLGAFHGLPGMVADETMAAQDTAHYRSGAHEQWRDEFPAEDQGLAEALIGRRIEDASERAVSNLVARAIRRTAGAARDRDLTTAIETAPWTAAADDAVRQLCGDDGPDAWQAYRAAEPRPFLWPGEALRAVRSRI